MASEREYSNYQKKIIGEYYRTAEQRGVSNLQEIVTELYLAETEKKRQRLWERARKSLETLGMKQTIIEHILSTKKPEVLASHVNDLF